MRWGGCQREVAKEHVACWCGILVRCSEGLHTRCIGSGGGGVTRHLLPSEACDLSTEGSEARPVGPWTLRNDLLWEHENSDSG